MDSIPSLVKPLSQVVTRELEWLWPGRLALGKLSIFDGDPEVGKSFVTLDLCARITTGRSFPDGSGAMEPATVIVLNAEDGADDTVAPRLRALGAATERVFIMHDKSADSVNIFRLPADIGQLDEALTRTRAALVVLDPIVGSLDSTIN